uniref:Uncharacterized protein n=1 Tax=Avena sativa TaxID=4498 RepID=A0ACD5TST1_AVESA
MMASGCAVMRAGAAAAEKEEATAATGGTPHANLLEILPSLPTDSGFPPYQLRRYGGFLLPDLFLLGVATAHARFRPRPTDVLLASFPKSGTTWLKALSYSALHRAAHPPSAGAGAGADDHPLHRGSPHDLVHYLDVASANNAGTGRDDPYEQIPSPRLLATHLPYSLLPHAITGTGTGTGGCGGGRIVYVCRDPKDTLVSYWHFYQKTAAELPGVGGASSKSLPTFEGSTQSSQRRSRDPRLPSEPLASLLLHIKIKIFLGPFFFLSHH